MENMGWKEKQVCVLEQTEGIRSTEQAEDVLGDNGALFLLLSGTGGSFNMSVA